MTVDPRTLETFFFGESSRRLFGALANPKDRDARVGIVISPPFGEEIVNTYNRLSRWSKERALEGFAVLRFHPYGTGESDGTFADFTLDGAAADLITAVEHMRRQPGIQHVAVLGLRFGAAAAVRAAATHQADSLVLWSPVIDLSQYFRELLRFKLTTEMVQQRAGGVKPTLKSMTAELVAGRTVDVVDYEFSPALHEQMVKVDAWPDAPPAKNILILARPMEDAEEAPQVDAWKAKGCDVTRAMHKVPVFWEDFRGGLPPEYTETTKAWLTEKAARGGAS